MLKENNNIPGINEQEKRDWLINIIIGVRQEVLVKLRALSDSFDREKYTTVQRNAINQEIREIAELVSEKDSAIKRLEESKGSYFNSNVKEGSLVDIIRKKVIEILNEIRDGIFAIEYDGEYSIIDRELKDIEAIVRDKDRLVHSEVQCYYRGGTQNPHLSRYFKLDDEQDIE